jgi:hypothetical protein
MRKLAPVLLLVCLAACDRAKPTAAVAPASQEPTTAVEKFTRVSISVPADVVIVKSAAPTLSFAGDAADIDKIVWTSTGGELVIRAKTPELTHFDKRVAISIGAVDLAAISLAGSGAVVADTLSGSERLVRVSGSGTVSVNRTDGDLLRVVVSGSGAVVAAGSAAKLDVTISGSGNVDAKELQATQVMATVSGSGDAKVAATETLTATVTGSGNVRYRGTPKVVDHVTGSGRVEKL